MLLAAALATWSVQDPSLSHATNAPVRNLLGVPGAIVADLLMQLFGIAVGGAGAADRGLGLAARHPPVLDRERLRLLAWVAGVLLGRELCRLPAAHRRLAAAGGTRRRHRRFAVAVVGLPRR